MLNDSCELILYACPVGPMADRLENYFTASLHRFGENAAHRYMPHCTLTGFLHDHPTSLPLYVQTLDTLVRQTPLPETTPLVQIMRMMFEPHFHGFVLESPWLIALVAQFIEQADNTTRTDPIRPKTWLHLSLAYEFPEDQHTPLQQLAEQMLDISIPTGWELRFYERHPNNSWTLHASWPLTCTK